MTATSRRCAQQHDHARTPQPRHSQSVAEVDVGSRRSGCWIDGHGSRPVPSQPSASRRGASNCSAMTRSVRQSQLDAEGRDATVAMRPHQ